MLALVLSVTVLVSNSVRATPAVLTTAAEVRALTTEAAAQALPVRLRGVCMGGADPEGIAFVVHDDTEGIYVQGPPELVAHVHRGDMVELEGVTDPGGFAPYVVARDVRVVGRGDIPAPIPVSIDELNAGQMDARWVEFTGIVRSVEPKTSTDLPPPPPGTRYTPPTAPAQGTATPTVKMLLAAGSARVVVQVNENIKPEEYVDAEVKVRGLSYNLHNHNRQFVRPFVQVPPGVPVEIERPPPANPFGTAPRSVASLFQFEHLAGPGGHRVHLRGVVIDYRPGVALWLRDQERSLRVETAQKDPLAPGDIIDVVGYPAHGGYSAVLEDAIYRRTGSEPAPAPHVLTDVRSALAYDADLVQLDARLADLRRSPNGIALSLEWGSTTVRAELRFADNRPAPRAWQIGSVVRVRGICTVVADDSGPLGGLWEPKAFQLSLRDPGDLDVLQPPAWWNAEHIMYALAAFSLLALGAVAAVMLASRRRLADQEHRRAMAEAEFTAILSERNRVAREIHDTLSQSLGAISVQLELARNRGSDLAVGAREHLAAAHRLTRAALADARESIWNMRSQVLERCDLGEALEQILNQMTAGTGIEAHVEIDGDRRRLPPVIENNLLRVGQEAITNACRHAKPKHILVMLHFERRAVELSVSDDGVGFDMASAPSSGQRSFGLVGMRERAELLGGSAEIKSTPGAGTKVIVRVTV